jgi:flagellar hook-length control protein FliK
VINETNILSSILDTPANPEPSFQVSHLERNSGEQFDRVLQERTVFRQDKSLSAESQSFKPKDRPATEHHTPPSYAENHHSDARPVYPSNERPSSTPLQEETHSHSDEPRSKEPVNPFALPLERLTRELNPDEGAPGLVDHANASAVDTLTGLLGNHGLKAEGSPAIDTLKEFLAGLNVDSETIDQLIEALNNGDAAGVQGILNALRGLLQASQQVAQAPVAEIVAEVAGNRLNPPEQLALKLLVQAGLTQEEAQQVIQQVRAGTASQPATDNSTQLSKTAIDAIASKLNSENSTGSGNLQNGDSSGSAKNSSEGPRNFAGLAADRMETLASLVAPDKAGNAQTNPLITKLSASPLLNLNASGQPAQGVLAEGAQAPAAVADAAAKGVDFVKPAVTETYNGRASMDKPITAQIIEKFTLRGSGNHREVHIKLDPPSLGTIRMNVSTNGESVRATIVAENHVVKSIIENNLSQLKDSFTQQGVKVDSFSVLVGGNASHSAEGHKTALDYLGQLGREGSMAHEQAEEVIAFHRPVFLNENQSFSIFA